MPALSSIAIGALVVLVCGLMVLQQYRIWRGRP